ncbi:MAG: hypothetical protein WA869_22010 [Alloacidobacterium sp.]|jgi:hypothetical protein
MNLNMQGAGGAPQNLPIGDNTIVTGPMGDCVSIIVLYNYNGATNRYLNGCGWHGLGGAQVINMGAMLGGVPNVALTQVIIIPGPLQSSDYARGQTMAHVQAGLGAHGNVNVRYISGRSNATVNRQALIT